MAGTFCSSSFAESTASATKTFSYIRAEILQDESVAETLSYSNDALKCSQGVVDASVQSRGSVDCSTTDC